MPVSAEEGPEGRLLLTKLAPSRCLRPVGLSFLPPRLPGVEEETEVLRGQAKGHRLDGSAGSSPPQGLSPPPPLAFG